VIRYESRVHIGRPADAVYAALSDPSRFAEWTDMVDVDFAAGPPRVGDRGSFRLASGPIKGPLTAEVVEADDGRRLAYRVQHPWLAWDSVSELTPTPEGTELRYAGQVRLLGLRRLLEPLVGGQVRAGEAAEAERFKAMVEAAAVDETH
jgi:uncharacterized protein YndB with AHSA1/START domain